MATPIVIFRDVECEVLFRRYRNKRVAMQLFNGTIGPVGTATVNVPECPLLPGEVLIKDYGENQGILDALQRAGVVRRTGKSCPAGHAVADICELLVPPGTTH